MAEKNSMSDINQGETIIPDNEPIHKLDLDMEENRSHESHSRISKTENATNSHPLLYSPVQHFPDLIPEKPRSKITINSSCNDDLHEYDIEKHLTLQMPQLAEYNETLPGILFDNILRV